MKKTVLFGLLYIAFILSLRFTYVKDLGLQKTKIRQAYLNETLAVKEKLQNHFNFVYQGLRTISRMPGVRRLDPKGTNISADTLITAQELFNNLHVNTGLSEIYLVPIDFDPEVTKSPPLTFDALHEELQPIGSYGVQDPNRLEIFEYREMKKHNQWLKEHFPTKKNISQFNVPMLYSPEVITCDNSRFDINHPDDRRRSGIVLSLPYYNDAGELKGTVVGIMLSNVIAELLPNESYQLVNPQTRHQLGGYVEGHKKQLQGQTLKLDLSVPNAEWYLVASLPETAFTTNKDILQAKYFYQFSLALSTSCLDSPTIWPCKNPN